MKLTVSAVRRRLARFSRQRILVVGDLMLDRYVAGSVERISPEAPVPVIRVRSERGVPGGAANVAMNVRALGGEAMVAGIVGADAAGREIVAILRAAGVDTAGIAMPAGCRTTIKTRIVAERQQVARVDWDHPSSLSRAAWGRFAGRCAELAGKATGLILDDYDKGTLTQEVLDAVLPAARRAGIPVGYDPKRNHGLRVPGVTLVAPNCREAHEAAGFPPRAAVADPDRDETLAAVARRLCEKWEPECLLIKLGGQGVYLVPRRGAARRIPARAREVFDVSGAGDTVIAACVTALAAGAGCEESAMLGNEAAGVVVGKLGTATCSREELLAAVASAERDAR